MAHLFFFLIGVAHPFFLGGGTLILVTVDTFGTPRRYESSKTMRVTTLATVTRLIPVTVDTFRSPKSYESSKNDDNYEDGDRDLPDPCDC